ncbi:MAG: nucleotidyl transferase AbiEii/AbiGii toxin family protein [Metamycoplasmataceae bacterium]
MHNDNLNDQIKKILLSYPKLKKEMILKDIYLSEIIEHIVKKFNNQKWRQNYFICGGTSLSKCFKTSDRLSEDIDISIFGYTKNKGKNIIKDVSLFIDNEIEELKNKNINIIVKKQNNKIWKEPRNYLKFSFIYKEETFSVDIKAIKTKIDYEKDLEFKTLFNILDKENSEKENKLKIPIINLHCIVAEKLLVFGKKYNNLTENSDYENVKRLFRHIYDVYMIFDKKIIELSLENLTKIKNWYQEIAKYEKVSINNIEQINVFQDDFFNKSNLSNLKLIIDNECYEKVQVKKIILFFKNLKMHLSK